MRSLLLLLVLIGCSPSGDLDPGANGSGGMGAAVCLAVGADCAADENGCCDGATCVHTTTNPAICAAFCSEHSECKTGCCATIDDGAGSVCAPEQFCEPEPPMCIAEGGGCADDLNGCCDGSVCVGETAGSAMGTCATSCTDDSDCAVGCCVELANTPGSVCAPDEYCPAACIDAGESCARRVDECCAGTACVANELGTRCAELCSENTDCESGCCAVADNGMRVCSPAGHCF